MRRKKTVLALVILVILAAAGVVIGIVYVRGQKEPEESIVTVEDPEPMEDPHAGQAKSLLTGEWIDASLVRNRPIAIMMEDTKAALPLYGLNSAGVVYEAPVEGMKNLGYHEGYKYPHDFPGHYVEQQYLPDKMVGTKYYNDSDIPERIEKQIKSPKEVKKELEKEEK